MKRNLFLWQFGGFTFTVALGTLLHFLFEWTGSLLVTPFSAVNESTWEHMKLIFFPAFIYAITEFFFFKDQLLNYWITKVTGIIIALVLVPALFYTYSGAFGNPPAWVNIFIFFLSVGIGYFYEYKQFKMQVQQSNKIWQILSFLSLILIATAFIVFTFIQPQIPLFFDPIYKKTGII